MCSLVETAGHLTETEVKEMQGRAQVPARVSDADDPLTFEKGPQIGVLEDSISVWPLPAQSTTQGSICRILIFIDRSMFVHN